ncbi:thiaminase II [Aureimonas phyllosphaerae]|uniref:Aminopyrimidine aminohydrolase n=1 Tax=Aureimonas phyllosphaerae TaxID=1166078 RepID=A0A7W6BPZ5_9HYPH|nr:thiaminase II [Aureimonas phyllosphaerae]MBB3933894.1 thiaminase/transcriptional activator TenA [Aureimonas phyllosphaerae]MBB3958890.1 thiaminase/transcriptional activator TenA [Aureimonas phyllosphaerae]SFF20701.1 thiaminase (transcriptional activator TenA) [Aureimonas phyllosphaerae]
MDLFDHLTATAGSHWTGYIDHEFVRRMGDGSLPAPAFRRYLEQDYLFLIQFARANALAVYKSRTLDDMRAAHTALGAILDVELSLHVRLCAGWGLSSAALEAAEEHPATLAYTRYVLDCGQGGDLLDLHVALAPCVIGYAVIARRLAPSCGASHPYRDWIMEYAGDAYQSVAMRARAHLDRLAQRHLTQERAGELEKIFATACRLESDFWQMGLDEPASHA